MSASGLVALAGTYGLERGELRQLKLAAESFFDEFRAQLALCTGAPIRLGELAQSISTFNECCGATAPCQLVVVGSENRVAALLKIDRALACALVDCVMSGKTAGDVSDRKLTPVEENLLSNTIATACLRSAALELTETSRPGAELKRIESGTVADSLEQLVLARITCQMGAGAGALELAFPITRNAKTRAHSAAARALIPTSIDDRDKLRLRLADARAELVAVLGQVMMPLDAVRALQPGSVLSLRNMKDGVPAVELHFGDQVLFSGAVVAHRGWRRFVIQQTGVSDDRREQRRLDA
jgi:flagellar motor switch protein FliM